jgi:transposase
MSDEQNLKTDDRDVIIAQQAERIDQLEQEVASLKALIETKADAKASKKPKFDENYSAGRNKNAKKKPKGKSTGRKPSDKKKNAASKSVNIYPDDSQPEQCERRRTQYAWRLIDGKAVYIAYHLFAPADAPNTPLPPGVRNSRCEFGIEIILILAFLHYWIGVSLANAIQIMNFFTGLEVSKGQADSLMTQLANDWNEQYDAIAELIALQLIVYIDETGWKVGKKSCYTWVFSTSMHVLYRCGVTRKKTEATDILGEDFAGIGVTDDYAAYKSMFSKHQLCWAHLIRKAIKLALKNPNEPEYADFLDGLCRIYDDAKQLRDAALLRDEPAAELDADGVKRLQDRVTELCSRSDEVIITEKAAEKAGPSVNATADAIATFVLLQRELVGNLDCLFVFVENPEVEPTNNRSERNVRREAEIRKGARTSKTAKGAKRRSTIVSVLASLQTRITFTLANVLLEVGDWYQSGTSLFTKELQQHRVPIPSPT